MKLARQKRQSRVPTTRLARLFPVQLDVSGIVAEAKRQLHQEADYLAEAGFLKRYRSFIDKDSNFIVPRVHDDLTTRGILAMDYMPGLPLESLGEDGVEQKERDRVGALLQGLMFRELFEFRTMQSDPNFANYLYRPEEQIQLCMALRERDKALAGTLSERQRAY